MTVVGVMVVWPSNSPSISWFWTKQAIFSISSVDLDLVMGPTEMANGFSFSILDFFWAEIDTSSFGWVTGESLSKVWDAKFEVYGLRHSTPNLHYNETLCSLLSAPRQRLWAPLLKSVKLMARTQVIEI